MMEWRREARVSDAIRRVAWDKTAGLLVVLALHGAAAYALWHSQIPFTPREAVTLFVEFINPPAPAPHREQPKPTPPPVKPPEPVKLEPPPPPAPPEPQQLVVEAPVVLPGEPTAPPPPPTAPATEAPAGPTGPVQLTTELSVSCPKRAPPVYPALSRRMGEEGRVIVRVELDEQGRIDAVRIDASSGSARLDAAALAAVKEWRCSPAVHDGVAVRAVALQPFLFKLEGR